MIHTQTISPSTFLRSSAGRICVALNGRTVEELLERAQAALADCHFLEFRLDSLDHTDAAALVKIADFLTSRKDLVAVATCRRKAYGGNFSGTLAHELKILTQAAKSGFAIVDLEVESAEACAQEALTALRELGAAIMISYHDFRSASDPEAAFVRIQRHSPDFVKIVTTAHCLADGLKLIEWIADRSGEAKLVGIAMGEAGVISRILSLRAGCAFTFAAAPDGQTTAPGQMTAHLLRDLYRVEELDQATRIFGVAGNPVSHSLSPLMQNTAFRRERINAVYLPLKAESVEDLFLLAQELPLSGLSVTMPYKQSVMAHLANVDPMTARLGACNTIRLGADGKLYGFNTDVAGVVRPLEKRMTLKGSKVLVLGAGGAARAAVYGLVEKGAQVAIYSRSEPRARELAAAAKASIIARKQLASTDFDVLINATPCGMQGNGHALPIEPQELRAQLVFDLVYNPLETPLLKLARERGLATVQGVEMFVCQGARQFELWTGKPAPEAEMLRVVLFALQASSIGTPH